jgi:hypothetical protein
MLRLVSIMNMRQTVEGPRLRHGAIITALGYVLSWGVPFASFSILPKLYVAGDAAKTGQNIAANQQLLALAIFAFLLNFIGDILSAWGMYILVRTVNESVSMLVAWLRVVFAAVGLSAVNNLVTAHRLVARPEVLTALGQSELNAQVHVLIGAFNSQFAFSLILFGVYLVPLGWLMYRSGHIPKWLGVVIAINGAGWILQQAVPYFLPERDLGFLFFTSFGELFLLVWLIGWGSRLKDPVTP